MKWLEDFLSLAETGNFTRSAQARYLTQPALSRRIRALEHWTGVSLIDRSSHPIRLSPAGELFRGRAVTLLEQLHETRALMRRQRDSSSDQIRFALPHNLSLSFFPKWLTQVHREFGAFPCQMAAGNGQDALVNFVEGNCDFLICYQHPCKQIDLHPAHYPYIRLGEDDIRPYTRCSQLRVPQFNLPGTASAPTPLLNYTPEAYLRRVVDTILEGTQQELFLKPFYETAMAEGLKNMVLEGHGVAFLPASTVAKDMRSGQLMPLGDSKLSTQLEIRLYRDARSTSAKLGPLWNFLQEAYR